MKRVNNYYFQKISSVMAKEFGSIERGKEEQYSVAERNDLNFEIHCTILSRIKGRFI